MQDLANKRPEGHEEAQRCLAEEASAFLERHVAPVVLAVFPEWQGLLLECPVLGVSVWIVRAPGDGRWLHQVTGQPALLLADVIAYRGRRFAEVWEVLQDRLIVSSPRRQMRQRGSRDGVPRSGGYV